MQKICVRHKTKTLINQSHYKSIQFRGLNYSRQDFSGKGHTESENLGIFFVTKVIGLSTQTKTFKKNTLFLKKKRFVNRFFILKYMT